LAEFFHHENIGDSKMRLSFFKSKKGLALLATLAIASIGAVGAYAYFTTGASGTGTASVGGPTALTIKQDGTVSGLLPGGPTQNVEYTITNNTSTPEYVNYVDFSVTGPSYCGATNFQTTQNSGQVVGEIAAGATFHSTTLPGGTSGLKIAMLDTNVSQDGCEGASVALNFIAYP
jgi:hypothetical protein